MYYFIIRCYAAGTATTMCIGDDYYSNVLMPTVAFYMKLLKNEKTPKTYHLHINKIKNGFHFHPEASITTEIGLTTGHFNY